jgi:hypothetical protein
MGTAITRDEAFYFLVFSAAAADFKEGGFFADTSAVSSDEWDYLELVKDFENLELSDAVQINKSMGSADSLIFHGYLTDTFSSTREGANQGAYKACCEVLKNGSRIDIFKTITHMFSISKVTDEDKNEIGVSGRELELVVNTATELGLSDEETKSIARLAGTTNGVEELSAAAEQLVKELSAAAEQLARQERAHADSISGMKLYEELVSLSSVGAKVAATVIKNFENSANIVLASAEDLEDLDGVLFKNALAIKERFQ